MSANAPSETRKELLARPFSLCGRKCYLSGMQDGTFPDYGWHIVDEMAGVWIQPIKIADGFWVSIETSEEGAWLGYKPSHEPHFRHWLGACDEFTFADGGAWVEHKYELPEFTVSRKEFVPVDEAALGVDLSVETSNGEPRTFYVNFLVRFDLLPAFATQWPDPIYLEAEHKAGAVVVHGVSNQLLPPDHSRWTAVLDYDTEPASVAIGESLWGPQKTAGRGISALLKYRVEESATSRLRFVLAGDYTGESGAVATARRVTENFENEFAKRIESYHEIATNHTSVKSPESELDDAFTWSKFNLEWLTHTSPILGTGTHAGQLDFTSDFGADTGASIVGMLVSGLHETAKQTLRYLAATAALQNGRIPSEVACNGGFYARGGAGISTLFVRNVWDVYKWTGDDAYLKEMYPACRDAVRYVLSRPVEDGIILLEYEDDPNSKIDKMCPAGIAFGFDAFAKISERLGEDAAASEFADRAAAHLKQVEELFWVEEEGLYAGKVDDDNHAVIEKERNYFGEMHVVFDAVGYSAMAKRERVERALAKFDDPKFATKFGLYLDSDKSSVMPITSGHAAITEFNYDRVEAGFSLLRMISRTVGYTMPGGVPEYIDPGGDPTKANPMWCYSQLWSAGSYAQGLIHGLLKADPDAARQRLTITPRLPQGWESAAIKNLKVGGSKITIQISADETVVTNVEGPKLDVVIEK